MLKRAWHALSGFIAQKNLLYTESRLYVPMKAKHIYRMHTVSFHDGFKMNTIIQFGIHKQTLSGHSIFVCIYQIKLSDNHSFTLTTSVPFFFYLIILHLRSNCKNWGRFFFLLKGKRKKNRPLFLSLFLTFQASQASCLFPYLFFLSYPFCAFLLLQEKAFPSYIRRILFSPYFLFLQV